MQQIVPATELHLPRNQEEEATEEDNPEEDSDDETD